MTDPAAWPDAYGDRLFRYALSRLRDARAAEELVQETLVTAFRSRDRFQGASSELTWMTGILRNKIFEHLRRQAKEAALGAVDDGAREDGLFAEDGHWTKSGAPADWGGEPAKAAESAEFAAALRACLDALTPAVAQAFVLREMEGLGPAACAEALGVPSNHLAVLLYRARMRLRRCLERSWFAPEPAR
ncbi:MAG: sigma-70 family RNA polymerase sigma factor [Elusimicrobia bacterium]|nr:sigma-70 family RNA polymerase sigma factor [Elusimicrobiota bacterium]